MSTLTQKQWTYLLVEHPKLIESIISYRSISEFDIKPYILYHYTSLCGLKGIVENRNIWLTDCQYLNDTTEYIHAIDFLKIAVNETKSKYENEFIQNIEDQSSNYEAKEIILTITSGVIGSFESLCRYFIFCASANKDSLPMIQYSKGERKSSLCLGISFDRYNFLERMTDHSNFKVYKVVYNDNEKLDIIKRIIDVEYNAWKKCNIPLNIIKSDFQRSFNDIRLLFKHNSFSYENEMRIIAAIPKENLKEGETINNITYKHRQYMGFSIPYITFPILVESIFEIITSPGFGDEDSDELMNIVKINDLKCEISKSRIPIRF